MLWLKINEMMNANASHASSTPTPQMSAFTTPCRHAVLVMRVVMCGVLMVLMSPNDPSSATRPTKGGKC